METESPAEPLRVLVVDGRRERLQEVGDAVRSLGHEVLARESDLSEIGHLTATEGPDVALVIVGEESDQALRLIGTIVQQAACPVIAILDVQDRAFINEAAKRGLFAYITEGDDPAELQSAIDIVLRRFSEYHALEGAFARRAVTERAKGILMERHGVDERAAFELLRGHARRTGQKIVAVAENVVDTHPLLPARRAAESAPERAGESADPGLTE
jgi:AmiR/NasT family two-component response regulator